jgi:CDP-6-deoxy-D-xylo-4-hexulose-3-dehydrase
MPSSKSAESVLRSKIFEAVDEIFKLRTSKEKFVPGRDMVRYSGPVYDQEEVKSMFNAILDGWLGVGKYVSNFENEFAKLIGVKKAVMVNSGSSANLLAVASFFSQQLENGERLKAGDEVITPALTFPTTLNPILQHNLVPVFIDIELGSYNVSPELIEGTVSDRTRAIFVSHTLGNPNDMRYIMDIAEDHNLLVIEDSCDALGSKYCNKFTGSFGNFGTFSFYPAHQITTGEGGMLVTDDEKLASITQSLRDWGRACIMPVCNPLYCGDRECPKSASFTGGGEGRGLPEDYDKRYTYVNIGYNLKPIEVQAAMGLVQIRKLPAFCEKRKRNFKILYDELKKYEDYFILPKWLPESEPCWFSFPLTVKLGAPFRRKDLVEWLIKHNIEVKMLFSGNILKHPAYKHTRYRVTGSLENTNYAMYNSFFIGVYPGLSEEELAYVINVIKRFIAEHGR